MSCPGLYAHLVLFLYVDFSRFVIFKSILHNTVPDFSKCGFTSFLKYPIVCGCFVVVLECVCVCVFVHTQVCMCVPISEIGFGDLF